MGRSLPPGFWLAVLGFLATVVTIMPPGDLTPLQRGLAVFGFFLLTVMEIRALYRARSDHESDFQVVLLNFQEIIQTIAAGGNSAAQVRVADAAHISPASLKYRALSLSDEILQFLIKEHSPAPPRPATWHRDVSLIVRHYEQIRGKYAIRFGARVLAMRDELAKRGLQDPKLDEEYRDPVNPIGMRWVAEAIGALAGKLPDNA